jgi:serine palmitoyltransferase
MKNAPRLTVRLQEIDELVDEWSPEPLVPALNEAEVADLASVPVTVGPPGPKPKIQSTGKTAINLASYNFAGLSGNDKVKDRAVSVLRNYGLGSCGPPGFYGTNGGFAVSSAHYRFRLTLIGV